MALSKQVKARRQRNRVQRWGSAWQRKANSDIYRALAVTRTESLSVAATIMSLPDNDEQLPALQAKYRQLYEEQLIQRKALRVLRTLLRAEWLKIKNNPCFWHDMGIDLKQLSQNNSLLSDIHWRDIIN